MSTTFYRFSINFDLPDNRKLYLLIYYANIYGERSIRRLPVESKGNDQAGARHKWIQMRSSIKRKQRRCKINETRNRRASECRQEHTV